YLCANIRTPLTLSEPYPPDLFAPVQMRHPPSPGVERTSNGVVNCPVCRIASPAVGSPCLRHRPQWMVHQVRAFCFRSQPSTVQIFIGFPLFGRNEKCPPRDCRSPWALTTRTW